MSALKPQKRDIIQFDCIQSVAAIPHVPLQMPVASWNFLRGLVSVSEEAQLGPTCNQREGITEACDSSAAAGNTCKGPAHMLAIPPIKEIVIHQIEWIIVTSVL